MDARLLDILLVENNPGDVALLRVALADATEFEFNITHVATLADARQQAQQPHHAILLDLSLPDSFGLATIEAMRDAAPTTPIIVMTSNADLEMATASLRHGVQDYVIKGQSDGNVLSRTIRYAIERKATEEALKLAMATAQRRSAELDAVFDAMVQPVIIFDAQAKAVRANRAARSTFGTNGDAADEIDFVNLPLCHGDGSSLSVAERPSRRALAGQVVANQSAVFVNACGQKTYLLLSAAPLRSDGAIVGAVVVSQDVTRRHQMEEELRQSHAQLEQRVAARTAELADTVGQLQEEVMARIGAERGLRANEQALRRANRALKVLGECGQTLVRAGDQASLLKEICRNIVQIGGYSHARVGPSQVAAQGARKSSLKAHAGLPPRQVENMRIDWSAAPKGGDATAPAIRIGKIDDRGGPPREGKAASKKTVAGLGVRSAIALPLVSQGRNIGCLSIYAAEADAFDSEEVTLLSELADDLAFGISALRTRVENQLAQKALFEQARIMDAFFEHTVTPLAFMDSRFNFIKVNAAYASAAGRTAEYFEGKNHFALYPSRENQAIFHQAVHSRQPYQAFAKPFANSDFMSHGLTYWDWTLVPILDGDQKVELLVLSLKDVTERKQAENRIYGTNALLGVFSKRATQAEYLDDVVKLISTWTTCRYVGIRLIDAQNQMPYEAYVGFSKNFWRAENLLSLRRDNCICIRLAKGETVTTDGPLLSAGGSAVCNDVDSFASQIKGEIKCLFRGRCIEEGFKSLAIVPIRSGRNIIGMIHIAEKKPDKIPPRMLEFIEQMSPLIGEAVQRFQMAEALRVSEEFFRSLFESSQDCICHLTLDGKVQSVNRAGCQLHGLREPSEMINRSCKQHVTENLGALELALALAAKGESATVQYQTQRRGGVGLWWDCSLTPMLGASLEPEGILMVARDMTERRRLEREIVEISTQERRRIGRDLHDALGQQLTGISFLSKVLQKQLASKGLPQADAAGQIASLVSQSVNHTRLLARGLSPVEPKADGLMGALQELAANTQDMCGIPCQFQCKAPVFVEDDYTATQLYYIAQEAINNAARHSKAKRLRISLVNSDRDLQLLVDDNGVGIGKSRDPHRGLGLRTMRYRAGMIGAQFDILRRQRGTRIACCVPHRHGRASGPMAAST